VEGDVAAALDLEQLDTARTKQLGAREQMFFLRRPAECDDGRMFEEEQNVFGNRPVNPLSSHASL